MYLCRAPAGVIILEKTGLFSTILSPLFTLSSRLFPLPTVCPQSPEQLSQVCCVPAMSSTPLQRHTEQLMPWL